MLFIVGDPFETIKKNCQTVGFEKNSIHKKWYTKLKKHKVRLRKENAKGSKNMKEAETVKSEDCTLVAAKPFPKRVWVSYEDRTFSVHSYFSSTHHGKAFHLFAVYGCPITKEKHKFQDSLGLVSQIIR